MPSNLSDGSSPSHGHPDKPNRPPVDTDPTTATTHLSTAPTSTSSAPDAAPAGLTAPAPSASAKLAGLTMRLRQALRQYPDFPSPGILFEDIMPIFADPSLHGALIDALELHVKSAFSEASRPQVVVGLEARGFIFGPSLALRLGAAFVPVRKKGKLPGECATATYKKEYGEDLFQMQRGAITAGQRVIVVDDLIATGGSAAAAGSLVEQLGGTLLSYIFMIELDFLKGRDKLKAPVYTLLQSQ